MMKMYVVINKNNRKIEGIYQTINYPLEVIENFIPEDAKENYIIEIHEAKP